MTKPFKIAVVRYRFIGDTLLSVPFLKALRTKHPDAVIHLICGEDAISIMEHCPYIDEAIAFEPRKLGFWQSIRKLKKNRYDAAYLLKRSFSSALLIFMAGIPERIGFDTEKRRFLLTHAVPYYSKKQHEAQCFMDLIGETFDFNQSLDIKSWIPEATIIKADSMLKQTSGPKIILHPTSTNRAKCWPMPHFEKLAKMLITTYDAQLYCMGTLKDQSTCELLQKSLPVNMQNRLTNLCGQTTLLESMAMLRAMDLVVANDSGMIHMAAAMGTPVVSIFGPMDPEQWRPLSNKETVVINSNLTCRPCRMKISCNHSYPCLMEILPEMVFAACKPYLNY